MKSQSGDKAGNTVRAQVGQALDAAAILKQVNDEERHRRKAAEGDERKMPNRRLTSPEIAILDRLQASTVEALDVMAAGYPELLFALRRRLFTRLMHIERGTPAHRNKLKAERWQGQQGLCAMCNGPMEQKGSELDRLVAWKGYTTENTRLVDHDCHVADQKRKGFGDVEADIAERLDDLDEVASEVDTCEIMTDEGLGHDQRPCSKSPRPLSLPDDLRGNELNHVAERHPHYGPRSFRCLGRLPICNARLTSRSFRPERLQRHRIRLLGLRRQHWRPVGR